MKKSKIPIEKKKYVIDYYNKKWVSYDYDRLNKRIDVARPILEKITEKIEIKKFYNILDIGTGPGTIPMFLVKKMESTFPIKIFGIDPSLNSITTARKIVNSMNLDDRLFFELGSFEEIPFPNNFFDVIISNAAFNMSINKFDALNEIVRVVKKGGQIILADCFRDEETYPKNVEQDDLWVKCISGSVTAKWLTNITSLKGLILEVQEDLTQIIHKLIKTGMWNWKEFIDYHLKYYFFKFSA